MDQIFKETAKKSPVITLAFVAVIYIFSLILEKEIPYWLLLLITLSILVVSSLTIFLNYQLKYKNKKRSIEISETEISHIKTEGGEFKVGSSNSDVDNLTINKTKIDNISTGGGNFTIGNSRD